MKQALITTLTVMIILVSFSMTQAKPCDDFGSSWKQAFASSAAASGLNQATVEARAAGKSVIEIVCAALAAGFGDHAIIVALVNANTGRAEIISAASEAGMDMQIVVAVLGGLEPPPEPSHPDSIAGGADIPPSVSPSAF